MGYAILIRVVARESNLPMASRQERSPSAPSEQPSARGNRHVLRSMKMPKWDSGTNDCEEQDLIMQAGAPLQATRGKRTRSREREHEATWWSTAKKRQSLGVHCALCSGKIMGGSS